MIARIFGFIWLAGFIEPTALAADGAPVIDLTRLTAHTNEQDINNDGLNDQLLLGINPAGDAADLTIMISGGPTGEIVDTQTFTAVVPARWPVENLAIVNFVGGSDPEGAKDIVVWIGSTEMILRKGDNDWEVRRLSIQKLDGTGTCSFNYATGRASISTSDGDRKNMPIGALPSLRPYWWQSELPTACGPP